MDEANLANLITTAQGLRENFSPTYHMDVTAIHSDDFNILDSQAPNDFMDHYYKHTRDRFTPLLSEDIQMIVQTTRRLRHRMFLHLPLRTINGVRVVLFLFCTTILRYFLTFCSLKQNQRGPFFNCNILHLTAFMMQHRLIKEKYGYLFASLEF